MSETSALASSAQVELECDPTVNFALQQNHVPVVKALRIKNSAESQLNEISVRIRSEPAFFEPWEASIVSIGPGSTHALTAIDLQLSAAYLAELTEAITGTIQVEVWRGSELLTRRGYTIELLAYDGWSGLDRSLPEILAAFVLPNHPIIEGLLAEAATTLGQWTGDASLSGYQSKNPSRVMATAAAIFTALQARGIRYCNPPASFEHMGQKIRLPERIMEHKLATCLDLATLMAACLEQAGLFPLIVITKDHAFAGVWMIEDCFADAVTDDPLRLRKRVDLNEIVVFETTMLTSPTATFEQASQAGRDKLKELSEFQAAIDIHRCRKNRIRPLPIRVTGATVIDQSRTPDSIVPLQAAVAAQAETAAPRVEAHQNETPETRLDRWKRKLLDLTLHNRLINFKESKKTVEILCPDLAALEDALAEEERFKIFPKLSELGVNDSRSPELHRTHTGQEAMTEILRSEFAEKRLRSSLTNDELDRRLLEIYRTSKASMEEGGASSLYLALGFLAWYETKESTQRRMAPIILIPVELQRNSVQEGFRIRQTDDDPRINITLMELLGKDFDLRIAGLDPIPEDHHGVDVRGIITRFRQAIKHIDRWDIVEEAQIGLFSFTKFLMWRDLDERSEDLATNRVVNHLIYHPNEHFPTDGTFPDPDQLDEQYQPKETFCPLPSDSSQLAAVFAAAQDKSFVLFGPPGTGKSQTITNLICHGLATGKSVLFVSEKMAALNVVRGRLAKIGLGPFCLELHSNKAQKMQVIAQLGESLDRFATQSPDDWTRDATRLAQTRQELNQYVRALHQQRSTGESVFRGLSKLIGLKDVPCISLTSTSWTNVSRDQLDGQRDVIDRLQTSGEACGHPKGHAWSGVQCDKWGPGLQREVEQSIKRLDGCVSELETRAISCGTLLGIAGMDRITTIEFAVKLAGLFLSSPRPPAPLLAVEDWVATEKTIREWISCGRRRDALRSELFQRYREELLQLDLKALFGVLEAAQRSWPMRRWWKTRAVHRSLCRVATTPASVAIPSMGADLQKARLLQDEDRIISAANEQAVNLLGSFWNGGKADWAKIDQLLEWCGQFRRFLETASGRSAEHAATFRERWAHLLTDDVDAISPSGRLGQQLGNLANAVNAFWESKKALETKLAIGNQGVWAPDPKRTSLGEIRSRLAAWTANLGGFRAWCSWQAARKQALERGLDPLVAAYEGDGLATKELRRIFDRSFYQVWVESIIEQDSNLAGFAGVEHERKIQRFREIDEQYMALTKAEVQARLAGKRPLNAEHVNENSEMGILRRQLQKRRAHMPVRSLFQKIPNLLPRLKPCLLMSPISVAQYLDAGFQHFDLVVFDEASQIPVWDAVGAIARGKEVVIVGDPKQLPPTNFFNRADEQELDDDDVVEDLESILDDCIAAQLPQMELRWHYRSRHESLIAFSNYHYYNNSLLTFPSPFVGQGVTFRYVSTGLYDKGKSRTNKVEAEAVIAEVLRRLCDPELSKLTIGIVTFSVAQQTLVEDLLDAARRANPEIEPFFKDAASEPVFVKNLENVQGDERDVILFSICYGPDAEGRVSHNFGPLNRDGGERRLNVAVTRARNEVVVFSSLKAEKIELSRTRARGVQDLKYFLDYAQRGPVAMSEAIAQRSGEEFESPFEQQVCLALRERGHLVDTQVGCSGYRIDLAVADRSSPGRYMLGIECDGANYHSAKSARDRDRLRAWVLSGLGWRLHRVWSTDWWADPETELKRIEAAIEVSKQQHEVLSESPAPTPVNSPPSDVPSPVLLMAAPIEPQMRIPLEVYHAIKVQSLQGSADTFYDSRTDSAIKTVMLNVVKNEGPISLQLLAARVLGHWGLSRRTDAAMDRIGNLVAVSPLQRIQHGNAVFLWPLDADRSKYEGFRIPGDDADSKRDAADIPPEEISNAAAHVLKHQIGLPLEGLIRETAALLGFRRLGPSVEQHVRAGVQLLIHSGGIEVRGGNIVLLDAEKN